MHETACAGTFKLRAGTFLDAGTVEGRDGAVIGTVGAAGAVAWGVDFAFCAGTRGNREDETVGPDFRF
jgi:hypothetical protein